MGQAGASIARVLDAFVHLSIPRVLVLKSDELPAVLVRTVGSGKVSAVRQGFHGQLRGEAIVVYGEARCNDLSDLMGYDQWADDASDTELLRDVGNLFVGACLRGIAEQLRVDIAFSAPSLMAGRVTAGAGELLCSGTVPWSNALLVEVNFRLEQRSFACHLIMLIPENEIKVIASGLERFLDAIR